MEDRPFPEKVAEVSSLAELDGMELGLKVEAEVHGHDVCPRKINLIALRRVEILKSGGSR